MERLSLLTWNIYGLQRASLHERTAYVCQYIARRSPSIVFLQEVIHQTWSTITEQLQEQYRCFQGQPKAHYFPALLMKKDDKIALKDESVIDFPSSTQGRYLIELPITFSGTNLTLLTSHIESMDQVKNVSERKKQLKTAFDIMSAIIKEGGVAIFGGDMNTFDTEISDIGLPNNVVDTWVYTGSVKSKCKTWNTNVLVHRPDRVYFGPTDGPATPTGFEVIGGEKLPGRDCYPSDHLGIWIDFEIEK